MNINSHDNFELEMEEPFSMRVEEPASTEKPSVCSWLRRIVALDDVPNQKQHHPVFIIAMCILHISIYLSTYINIRWRGQNFAFNLFDLLRFFVPCMRPTPDIIRIHLVNCNPSIENTTCYYDDELKKICFSFMYPHQLWRMVTVNLLHISWFHLLANISKQLLYGIPLERKYGSVRVAVIYWLSELSASLSFMLKNKEKYIFSNLMRDADAYINFISLASIGASGSLYGLMLFFTMDRLIAMRTNPGRRLFILVQLVLLVVLPVVASIVLIIIFKLTVAHSAHFGGGLVGFLFGVGMLDCPLPWNNEHCICRAACRRIVFAFLVLYYVITFTIFFQMDAPIVYWLWYKS